jgi:hypothetical protein
MMKRQFWQMKKDNGGVTPPFHPTLAALSIVLTKGTDFSEIRRDHPKVSKHSYYTPHEFPDDISNLLPPSAEHWWESLGKW